MDRMFQKLKVFPPSIIRIVEKLLRQIPSIKKQIDDQTSEVVSGLRKQVKPYSESYQKFDRLPEAGIPYEDILFQMEDMTNRESSRWRNGYVSGGVYHGDAEHIKFLNKIYSMQSQNNPLHSDLFPSASKFESEIVAMTAKMLGADKTDDEICGSVTSGGTESILLAMKTCRDWAIHERGISKPEMIVPVTAHAAFDKAAQYFRMKIIRTPVDEYFKADINSVRKAVNNRTAVIVVSAVTFPHGVVDPISELSEIAATHKICLHVDACLGGFVLPWARKLGYPVPDFDFGLKGVTSMSADTHKFGYAAKGTSVVMYRDKALRRYQYYTMTEWSGGLYFSPTFAGSRPGALSAACWASLISMGEKGYMKSTEKILITAEKIKSGIASIPALKILGDPLWVISFGSDELNIYQVMEFMSKKGWNLNGLYKPECIHICVTLRHTQDGVTDRFNSDLCDAVKYVKEHPQENTGMAPVYGMAANLPMRGIVDDILKEYMDLYYETGSEPEKT